MASIYMANSYPRELEIAKKERWPVLIPIGTMEYHSTICPYGCDGLVAQGIAREIAKKMDCVVLPTVFYGCSGYAVGGPEKNTINMDVTVLENYVYNILKSLFESGFTRNICLLNFHQTEDFLLNSVACLKASKRLIFEYLEDKQGYGWWGDNKNKDFYENLSGEDNPWNWIRLFNGTRAYGGKGDHAGIYECSNLEYLYPGSIKLERLCETDDWFAQSSKDMSVEIGERNITLTVDGIVDILKKGLPAPK